MFIYPEIERDPLQHICITEPIRLDHAEILHQDAHGILAYDHPAHLHLLAADGPEAAARLLQTIRNPYFILICSARFEPLLHAFHFAHTMRCRQFGYAADVPPPPDPRLCIAPPDDESFRAILAAYRMSSPEELARQRAAGELFFARDAAGRDVGFVGLHPEGCFGMLHVFPQQRGKGYGAALENFIIRFCMETGRKPYCQVDVNNPASLALQRKLGLSEAAQPLAMAWNDTLQA